MTLLADLRDRRLSVVGVVVAVVCAVTASALLALSTVVPYDFLVYRGAGYALLHGISLYGKDFPAELPFTYPPFASWPFVVLQVAPWRIMWWLWTFATILGLAWVIVRSFDGVLPAQLWRRALAISALLIAFTATSPVMDHVGYGQVNAFLMVACLADLLDVRPKWLPGGVLIGLAAAVKLVPALFIIYLLVTRRPKAAAIATLAATGATLAAFVASPTDSRLFFGQMLWSLDARVGLNNNASIGNQSLKGAMLRLLSTGETRVVWLAVAAVGVVIGMWAAHRAWKRGGELAGAAVTGLTAGLVSPVTWPHYLVWLIPAIGVLVGDGRRWRWVCGGVAVWLLTVARSPRIGQIVVDAHPSGLLFVLGEALRSSYVLMCVVLIGALAARPADRSPP
ncbi:MAG: alpha,2-mannosyltransferase [Mycobacterium sp.]|nr:alpha,2-mannosyltransferase [Mycobacterium sp.]